MGVDQQRIAVVVALGRVAGEVDLADQLDREAVDIGDRIVLLVGGRDVDVVDVEEKTAARAAGDLGEEVDLAHGALAESHIGRRVLEEHAAADGLLHLVDVIGDPAERSLVIGKRQQVVVEDRVVARPGEMLREQARLVAVDQMPEALEVVPVEGPGGADRQADPVQRQRIALADGAEIAMRRTAGAHVVLGMDLEPADIGLARQDRLVVLGLEADADARGDRSLAEGLRGHDRLFSPVRVRGARRAGGDGRAASSAHISGVTPGAGSG